MKTFYTFVCFAVLVFMMAGAGITIDNHSAEAFEVNGAQGIHFLDLSPDQVSIRVTGTGETTGHILDMHLRNLTDQDILINFPPVLIPSDGKHQSYIVPLPGSVTVPGGTTSAPAPEVIFPLDGYCADVHLPPVPLGGTAITPDNWITPRLNHFDQEGYNPELDRIISELSEDYYSPPLPYRFIVTPIELLGETPIGGNQDQTPEGHPLGEVDAGTDPFILIPTNPLSRDLQDEIFINPILRDPADLNREIPVYEIDPIDQPQLFAELTLDAVLKIIEAVDELILEGNLETPLSGRPDERETLIQQVLWIYTSVLKGDPYVFEDFRKALEDQFFDATEIELAEAPEPIREEFDSGAASMWDSFIFVGEQAKVIKEFMPHLDKIEDSFGGHSADSVKAHPGSTADEAAEMVGAEAHTTGDDVAFKGAPDLHTAAHEAAHVKSDSRELEPSETPPSVFEPAEPPCVCGEVNIVPSRLVNRATGEEIFKDTVSTLNGQLKFYPPELSFGCPDHCKGLEDSAIRIEFNYPGMGGGGTLWSFRPLQADINRKAKAEFRTRLFASCEGEVCIDELIVRTIEFTEENDCCERIRNQNWMGPALAFNAGDRRVAISGNSMMIIPNSRNERSRTFNFPDNIEAIFCNLGADQIYGRTSREMESSTSGESYTQSNLTISDMPERNNEMIPMEINSPYRDEILRQMPKTFPASYVISFQQSQNGDEFSFAMTMDKETCRTLIQIFQNGQIIESIDGVVQN